MAVPDPARRAGEPKDLTEILEDLDHNMHSLWLNNRRKNRAIAIMASALVILAVIVLLVSSDHAATSRNGRIADCRSQVLAARLDDFSDVVIDKNRDEATQHIAVGRSLKDAYARCLDTGGESIIPTTTTKPGG